jgi:hypothetical protein
MTLADFRLPIWRPLPDSGEALEAVCAQINVLAWCNRLGLATTEDLIEMCLSHDIL